MNIFETVKASVSMRQVAEENGLKPNRSGMCRCPFHNDRTPSMKLYENRFHCFGCGADGDVISMTARLFSLTNLEAARRLAREHHIAVPDESISRAPPVRPHPDYSRIQARFAAVLSKSHDDWVRHAQDVLTRYRQLLCEWLGRYAPKREDEEWHTRFIEACFRLEIVDYMLDMIREHADEDSEWLRKEYAKEVQRIEQYADAYHAEEGAGSHA